MDGFNPYAPPSVQSDAAARQLGGGQPLFTENQVAAATFLGSPIAGFIVMALNERRLGRPQGFTKMVVFGIIATVVVLAISLILPPEVPGLIVTVAYIMGMQQLARAWQGDEVSERLSAGTPKGSGWAVFGIGVAAFVVLSGLLFGLFMRDPSLFGA